ncbi:MULTISPECIES: RNaseH domain-containing protein [unclassified Streptomyces]|uniref:RNaseH domain-containing protein n=1 Tax=unclassified Streptomyces TaxID=2593676 RepID=UPI00381BD669
MTDDAPWRAPQWMTGNEGPVRIGPGTGGGTDEAHDCPSRDAAKARPGLRARSAHRPTANAWNPELLELTPACLQPGDDPDAWAAFVHQQRICKDDYRDVLGLPLALHLARLADEYALPHDEEEAVDPAAGPVAVLVAGPVVRNGSGQLTFDFDTDEDSEDEVHGDA